ncbi:AroM family protein [Sporosarcina cascadiensis]|uniref:AroM family protein n=1 Tax=Sporosarcina cascadiensis TaxID=2660747 RepID=UPI00189157FB|nr:AroM family protein [Sporosarcina cascadiensis]
MITLLTIGQTPRPDLLAPFVSQGIDNFQLIGALDNETIASLKNIKNIPNEELLYVVLRDGTKNISHSIIDQRIEQLILEYEYTSDAIAVLCMSDFNITSDQTTLVFPLAELKEKSKMIGESDTSVIFVPIEEQVDSAKMKWAHVKGKKHFIPVHPKTVNVLELIDQHLLQHAPDYVILDCYGFAYGLVSEIEQRHGCKCFGPQHLVTEKIKEIQKLHSN